MELRAESRGHFLSKVREGIPTCAALFSITKCLTDPFSDMESRSRASGHRWSVALKRTRPETQLTKVGPDAF